MSKLAFEYLAKYQKKSPSALMELTNTPLSTTYLRLKKLKRDGTLARKPGSGKDPTFTKAQVRRIVNIVKRYPLWPAAAIATEAYRRGMPLVSRATMGRTLNRAGMQYLKPRTSTDLKPNHIKDRIRWCTEFKDFDWENVAFSDESRFIVHRLKCSRWAFDRPNVNAPKWSPAAMVWGAISMRGPSALAIVEGIIDSAKYQEILHSSLVPSMDLLYPKGWQLQQDNASVHVSKSTREWFKQTGLRTLKWWPANSPDLNPIENLWCHMKDQIEKLQPSNKQELLDLIQRVWDERASDARNLIASMRRRIEACLAAKGKHFRI